MNIILVVEENKGWASVINSRFGRADGFILYSEENDTISYHSNELNTNLAHGAGIQTAQAVINMDAGFVITGGNIGPKALEVLKSAGIKMQINVGDISVKDALENYKSGKYI